MRLHGSGLSLWIRISGVILSLFFEYPISFSSNTIPLSFSMLIFTPFGLKIIYLVLLTFTAILLTLNQLASFFISTLTLSISSFKFDPDLSPAVSSANNRVKRSVTV